MRMLTRVSSIICCLTLLTIGSVYAEVVIIVHPDNPLDEIGKEQARNIFLGKSKEFQSGEIAVPIDQEPGNDARGEFRESVLGRTESQLKAYWSRLIFTGKGRPPKMVEDSEEVILLISENPNFIGYIHREEIVDSVKVIYGMD